MSYKGNINMSGRVCVLDYYTLNFKQVTLFKSNWFWINKKKVFE